MCRKKSATVLILTMAKVHNGKTVSLIITDSIHVHESILYLLSVNHWNHIKNNIPEYQQWTVCKTHSLLHKEGTNCYCVQGYIHVQ